MWLLCLNVASVSAFHEAQTHDILLYILCSSSFFSYLFLYIRLGSSLSVAALIFLSKFSVLFITSWDFEPKLTLPSQYPYRNNLHLSEYQFSFSFFFHIPWHAFITSSPLPNSPHEYGLSENFKG